MSRLIGRGVALGLSLVWEMDRRAFQRGTSRSVEVARYANTALDNVRGLPELQDDRAFADRLGRPMPAHGRSYLDDTSRGPGRATIWGSADLWTQVDTTARRLGTSASEAVRALVHTGLTIAAPEADVLTPEALRERALGLLFQPRTAHEFARAMWPHARDSAALRDSARRLILCMNRDGLLVRHPRAWKRPARWTVRPA